MVIRRLILVALCLSSSAMAADVSLQFRGVRVAELIEGVVGGVLKRDYVLAPEVSANAAALSLSIAAIPPDRVLDTLRKTVEPAGVAMVDRDGVLYFERASALPPPQSDTPRDLNRVSRESDTPRDLDRVSRFESAIYLPRHRPAEYLASALRAAGARIEDKWRSDVVVYQAPSDRLEKLAALLDSADRPVSSVSVRAALLEVSKSSDQSRSLSAVLSLLGGRLGVQLNPARSYGNAVSISGASLAAVLSAVDGDNRFRYLAEPQLSVIDGEPARLVVGQDVPVRGNTVIANNQTTQGVEYKTAGVVIEIEPRILRDSTILRIRQTVSDVVQTTSSGIDSPTLQKREASTTVVTRDGELVLIAGMDMARDSRTEAGLGWLPSIFQATSQSHSVSQLLLLLEVQRH